MRTFCTVKEAVKFFNRMWNEGYNVTIDGRTVWYDLD